MIPDPSYAIQAMSLWGIGYYQNPVIKSLARQERISGLGNVIGVINFRIRAETGRQ